MRIGIDAHMLGDHSGGNESYYKNILDVLDTSEFDIYIFVKRDYDATMYNNKYHVVQFKSHNPFVRNFVEIPYLCKKYKLDLMHMQYFIPFIRPCIFVSSIHDICFEHFRNIFTKKEYLRQKLLIPYAARKSKVIYASSKYSRNDIILHYGIDPSKILITYDAVNENYKRLSIDKKRSKRLRDKFGIGNSRYFLSVCNLQPRKNLVRLIKAYKKYKLIDNSDYKLVIVGKKAWMYSDIIKEAVKNSKEGDIIFTDYVSDYDLVRLYNDAFMFVYPSYFEGFGIPPLEAMACGVPVAVSKATSLPEVVGNAGIYFDPFSIRDIVKAMKTIAENESLREEMIKKGFCQVKKFDWKKTSKIWLDGYRNALERK